MPKRKLSFGDKLAIYLGEPTLAGVVLVLGVLLILLKTGALSAQNGGRNEGQAVGAAGSAFSSLMLFILLAILASGLALALYGLVKGKLAVRLIQTGVQARGKLADTRNVLLFAGTWTLVKVCYTFLDEHNFSRLAEQRIPFGVAKEETTVLYDGRHTLVIDYLEANPTDLTNSGVTLSRKNLLFGKMFLSLGALVLLWFLLP